MTRHNPAKLIGLILSAIVVLVALALGILAIWLTWYAKPRVEALASDALGLQVSVDGSVRVGLLPTLHLTANQVHMLAAHTELASAREVRLGLELAAAIHHRAHITMLDLSGLQITLDRDRSGNLDLRHIQTPPGVTPDLTIARATADDAGLAYRDEQTKGGFAFEHCKVELRAVRLSQGQPSADWLKVISFSGESKCGRFSLSNLQPTDIRFSAKGADGHMDFQPISLSWLGGQGSGVLLADFTGKLPAYRTHYQLQRFHADDFFKLFTPRHVGDGFLTLKSELTLHGLTVEQLRHSLTGEADLRGENLTLFMGDLDQKFAHFESAQNFTLVDSAAFFFAGPIGLGISKGYDYASILQGAQGSTVIRKLVSDWRLDKGVAEPTDVAMSTNLNRVALQGTVNLGTEQIETIKVALVDASGCTEAVQKVHGPIGKPELEPPNVAKLLATPTKRLIHKAARLMGEKCVAFYSGSVEPPAKSVQQPAKPAEPVTK